MNIVTDVFCRLLLLKDSSINLYVPTATNLGGIPVNGPYVSDLCLTHLNSSGDSNLNINLPQDRDYMLSVHNLPQNRDYVLSLLNISETCKTPSCIKTADGILSNIDETVNPCDDFYQFACGGWRKVRSADQTQSVLFQVDADAVAKRRAILDQNLTREEPDFIHLMKAIYDFCIDENIPRKDGLRPMKKLLKDLGGWPVLEENWNSSSFDWVDTLIQLHERGITYNLFMTVSVVKDPRNKLSNIIQLSAGSFGITDYYYAGESQKLAESFSQMKTYAETFGANNTEILDSQLLGVLNFEMQLHTLLSNRPNQVTYSTIHELKDKIPQIPWNKFFNTILKEEIPENETILVIDLDVIINVASLIINEEKRVVANYIFWIIINQSLSALGGWKPRRKKCFEFIDEHFKEALDSIYVRRHFPEDSKQAVLTLTTYIQNKYVNLIENADWLDEESKAYSLEKFHELELQFSYPEEILNDTYLSQIYSNITFNSENFFYNYLELRKQAARKSFSVLRETNPDGNLMWKRLYNVTTAGAAYNNFWNNIEIPPGILQDPVFEKYRPHYMNFGALGLVFAHELTHGFHGHKVNGTGYKLENLWSREANKKYENRTDCIEEQYANNTNDNGMTVNSSKTLNEDLADNLGLELAYLAYQSFVRDHGTDPLLPGLKYTPNQLFWISAATVYCRKLSEDTQEHVLRTDVHSPGRFRVIRPMSNIPEFAQDFNCPLDSTMNPRKKCLVWKGN